MATLGSTPELLAAAAIGAAASTALEPAFEVPRQDAWSNNRNRLLNPDLLARLVAQGGIDLGTAHAAAHRQGYSDDKLDALVYLSQTVPGVAEAMHLWRLGLISQDLFAHTLVKAGLDERYVGPIVQTKIEELIGLGDIAYAVVRGILPSPSYVPVPPPTQGTKVERFPQVNIDPEALAAKIGYSPEALQVMVGRSGLSMAPGMAAQANFRDIIADDDYLMAIAEGDLRTEWAQAVKDVSRQILPAGQYAELQLRGYTDRAARLANTAKHGMSTADSDLLYDVLGRAPSIKQVYIGLARGGIYDGQPKTIPEPFLSAVERANIRPEWYDIEYANRYSLPSAFVVRQLLRDGAIDAARASTIFQHEGWPPDLADLVAQHYATTTTAAADPHVAKAQGQLWTATHKSYIGGEINDATATTALSAAGVAAAAVPQILTLWNHELGLIRKELTATQIRKALNLGIVNPATGAPWTQPDALARLLELGYNNADATVFLQE